MKLSAAVSATLATVVVASQSPFSSNEHIDFFSKHLASHLTDDEFLLSSWRSLLNKYDSEKLAKEIDSYHAGSFPGTTMEKPLQSDTQNLFFESPKQVTFESVKNTKFTDHTLRIKQNNPQLLQLDTVDQYTGYLDIESEDKHLFFWFFESRNDPANDPIVLWLNGGPGCSSSTGLFFELGPSSINSDILPEYNPHSWNSNASVIFLDQPTGVGYSYEGPHSSGKVTSTAAASKDVVAFLELFFTKFSKFQSNKFHIAGESYAGHYIPRFTRDIIKHEGPLSYNVSSVLIGNGIFDPIVQIPTFRSMLCGEGGFDQLISDESCQEMDDDFKKCLPLAKACYHIQNPFACVPAKLYCDRIRAKVWETDRNPYDMRKQCVSRDEECYEELHYMNEFLDSEFVKNAVGADPAVGQYQSCSEDIYNGFSFTGDYMLPHQQYVAELLESGIPVLIYAGDKDFNCNWLGNSHWTDQLDYSGHESFLAAPMTDFISKDNEVHGKMKNFEIFTFLKVYESGHMVPFDQPLASLDVFNTWLSGDYKLRGK
ncbi:carboxypeptidase Y [[Candida] railenensis]|uniref:Carboxypeptidase n=1 Tax=[Candida] railenensis TaxID=45579 RepID=A0A9P0VYD6_9ASCO|nr:carboxypeptidase Y [[Candida] railenensis]